MATPLAESSAHCSAVMAPTVPSAWGSSVPSGQVRVPAGDRRTAPLSTRPAWYSSAVSAALTPDASRYSPAETEEQKAASCVSTSSPPESCKISNVCRAAASMLLPGGAGYFR